MMDTPNYNNMTSAPTGTYTNMSAVSSSSSTSSTASSDNYFSQSRRTSVSSVSSSCMGDSSCRSSRSSSVSSQTQKDIPVDPLSRHYPKPTAEINVAEALARQPGRWTLGYWVKNAKDMQPPVQSRELQATKFADAKRELLRAKGDLELLSFGAR